MSKQTKTLVKLLYCRNLKIRFSLIQEAFYASNNKLTKNFTMPFNRSYNLSVPLLDLIREFI